MATDNNLDIHVTPAAFLAIYADLLALKENAQASVGDEDAAQRAVAGWPNLIDDFLLSILDAARFQYAGAGSPEAVLAAPVGSTYHRTDGSTGTTFYVKESGTGNTGWVALGSVSLDIGDVADEVLLDADLTAAATSDWNAGGDGNYSLGGATWAIGATGVADTLGLVNATGLRFNATAGTTTVHTSGSRTASRLVIAPATLIPGWDAAATYIFEVWLSAWTNVSGDAVKLGVEITGPGTARLLGGGQRNSSGAVQSFASVDTTENGFQLVAARTAVAIRINAQGVLGLTGTYSAGFPARYSEAGGFQPAVATYQSPMDGAGALIFLAFPSATAGTHDLTIPRFRVRRVRG